MLKICVDCKVNIDEQNGVKKSSKSPYYRNICRGCRSQRVMAYHQGPGNSKRKEYASMRLKRLGIVKEYPCETCFMPCYKKYAKAFCSDKCRFMSYVNITDSCWLWTGGLNRSGYGKFSMISLNKKIMTAHRASYVLFIGQIDDGKLICHACDNKLCVNWKHLWQGSHKENMRDMSEKERQSAKLTKEEVITIREMFKKGFPQKKLCEIFSISSGNMSHIVNRKTWNHIGE